MHAINALCHLILAERQARAVLDTLQRCKDRLAAATLAEDGISIAFVLDCLRTIEVQELPELDMHVHQARGDLSEWAAERRSKLPAELA